MKKSLTGRDVIIYTRSLLPSLSQKEKKVADFILEYHHEISTMTINEMADKLDVSQATIVKLSKKLNCDGYLSLRRLLQDYSEEETDTSIQEDFSPGDNPDDIFMKVFNNSIVALNDTMTGFDKEEFGKAVHLLRNAKKVLFLGVGGSGSIADDIAHKFLKIGLEVQSYRDTHMQSMAASLLEKGDVAIGISHSGATSSVNFALKTAKEAGASTICLTNHVKSPITETADVKLVSYANNSPLTGENAVTRIVHLNILDALYIATATHFYDDTLSNLSKTNNAVKNQRLRKINF